MMPSPGRETGEVSETVSTVLVLFGLLQVKHMLADYFLQTPRMLAARGVYLHLGRAQHAGVHAVGTVAALALVGAGPEFIVWAVLCEWLVHFHIDWGKARFTEAHELYPTQSSFWWAMGVDQALHQFTYIVLVWAAVGFGAI